MIILKQNPAFGSPGMEPKWTRSDKDAVGCAYAASSTAWFTLSAGILNEVYYPTIDRPQIRDMQYLVTDGETFFHDERRHLTSTVEALAPHALGYRLINSDPGGRYRIVKEIIADPHYPCILTRTRLEGDADQLTRLRLFVLLAPHIEVGGGQNNGNVVDLAGRRILTANKKGTWLALGASVPFKRCSCGFVGASDGWTDLANNYEMDWEFDNAENGNIALTGEIDLSLGYEFTLGLSFGNGLHGAVTTLFQSLDLPFDRHRDRFIEQWQRISNRLTPLVKASGDNGALYHMSTSLLLAHEDKSNSGAIIASMSIPWGEARGDEDLGGYHLVWTRDMVNSALGLLAAGHTETPLRALIYLACAQQPDGGFHQNFWIQGIPYWTGVQLDEVAFPIILAWRLHAAGGLLDFDPYPMVLRAAAYLIRKGPATPQERWEENSGYSPSTLASNIAALICAACFSLVNGDKKTARFLEDYADFLECHIEQWTVTTQGTLDPSIPRHYIRIHPADPMDQIPDEDPNHGTLSIRNRPPGEPWKFPAKEIVDAGFLELVRYGIRRPNDPLMEDSLRVVDSAVKVNTPAGPCWRRYNHDGYGQRDDGGPFQGWGRGRAWPLLTGERGHYELAAGRNVQPYIRAMEGFATTTGLIPEQIWDEADRPEIHMRLAKPTGAAMPLMWAHAEYIKLLRSTVDGRAFDIIPVVEERYRSRRECTRLEIWKPNRQAQTVNSGMTLRIQRPGSFVLRWTSDEWVTHTDCPATPTALGIRYADIPVKKRQKAPIRFTFHYPEEPRWEGVDYSVKIRH
ncbi:MAG: glucan 1,4-alpha-glucosidase [bacterium]|nr:glucan 1,4-alpha-glucosidase [bacterium]